MRGFDPEVARRIKSYANGGVVRGPGTGTSDEVKTTIPKGSYIMPADSTKKLGADALGELGQTVPVNLSNGEYQMPPEQVHAVGVQALNQIKDATHAPVGARGFNPERRTAPASGGARGFNPKAAKAVEPRMFFAGGGSPAEEELKRAEQKAAAAQVGATTGATTPSAPTQPANTGGSWGSPAQPQSTATQPTPPSSSARGFAPASMAGARFDLNAKTTTAPAPNQGVMTYGANHGAAGYNPATRTPAAAPAAATPPAVRPASQPLDAQAASDRSKLGAAWDTVKDVNDDAGRAIADVAMLVPRGLAGAYDSAVVRPMRAAGIDANYLSPSLVPDGVDPSSITPFTDQKRMQQTAPSAAAPKPAPSIAAPGPSIDRIAPAGDATAPTAAIATPPAAPAGVANAADIDRSKMTNAQVAAANPAGQVRAVRGANGVMEFSGSNVSGPVSYADAQGNAIAGQGVTGRGWGGGVTSMPARGFSPSTATSSALSGALSDAVARGDMDAVQRYYFSRGQSFGGKTEQQVRADNLMAQAQNLMNRGHVGDAQKAQMLLSTLGTMEQNANTARGFDVQRDMANMRNAIDQGKLELDQKARGFDFRVAQRQEELYQRYQNAKTPEERNAIAQQIRDLKGTAPASWKAVALQGGTDAMGNKTEGVLAAVNEQTGEVRRLDSGQGGGGNQTQLASPATRPVGTISTVNGKSARWNGKAWEPM